jgi:hypothetical protein
MAYKEGGSGFSQNHTEQATFTHAIQSLCCNPHYFHGIQGAVFLTLIPSLTYLTFFHTIKKGPRIKELTAEVVACDLPWGLRQMDLRPYFEETVRFGPTVQAHRP